MALTQISTDGIKNGTITGSDLATNVDLVDNQFLRIGNSQDLQIHHDGSNSFIKDTGTGVLAICSNEIQINNAANTHLMIKAVQSGAAELYHNNSKKLETTANGVLTTGNIQLDSDSGKLTVGDSGDFELYHNGTSTYLDNLTGHLIIRNNVGNDENTNIYIKAKQDEDGIVINDDNAVELYFDNSKKFETSNAGVDIDNIIKLHASAVNQAESGRIRFAEVQTTMQGAFIHYDGNANELHIGTHESNTTNSADDFNALTFSRSGGHAQFHADVTFTGATSGYNAVWDKSDNALEFADNAKATFGNGVDLQIYHDGNSSFISNTTGDLTLLDQSRIKHRTNQFVVNNYANDESIIYAAADGEVSLYHNGSKKFETISTGANVTSANDAVLRVTTTGTASTDDARIELITQESTFTIQNDRSLGTDGALTISPGSEAGINIYKDGGVELYFNNSLRLLTTANGVTLDHNLLLDNATTAGRDVKWDPANDQLIWNDDTKGCWGDSADLQLYHSGHSVVQNTNSGAALLIASHETRIVNAAFTENIAIFSENGSVQLNHDDSEKFRTVSNGIHVTGHVRPPSTRDNTDDIGGAGQRWDDIFATNSTIQTSDEKEKENITDTDLGLDFINKLKPISFKFKGKTRTHYGLIAQDIETVITNLGKTTTQFAPLIKNTLEDGTESYGLRYTELIAPLIKAIQELSAEVAALKAS